jgi:hypothetical protein
MPLGSFFDLMVCFYVVTPDRAWHWPSVMANFFIRSQSSKVAPRFALPVKNQMSDTVPPKLFDDLLPGTLISTNSNPGESTCK